MLALQGAVVTDLHVLEVTSPKQRAQRVSGRDFYALSYRLAGRVVLEAGGKRVVSVPDSITFTPRGMSYRTSVTEDTRMIAVHFRLASDLGPQAPMVLEGGAALRGLFERLVAVASVGGSGSFLCMSVFYRLLAELEQHARGDERVVPCARQARAQIDASFADEDLCIGALAEAAGVSDSYLRRAFGRAYGESPVAYLMRVRLQNAKHLLESEYFTVSEVAARCGFRSLSYFIQSFRAQTGESPGAYRKRTCGG